MLVLLVDRPGQPSSLLKVLVLRIRVRHHASASAAHAVGKLIPVQMVIGVFLATLSAAAVAGDEADDESGNSAGRDCDDQSLQGEQDRAGLDNLMKKDYLHYFSQYLRRSATKFMPGYGLPLF